MSVPLRPARNELRYAWLGEVYVDLTANQLHDRGRETRLTPKAMAVLRELMLRQNLVVRRDDLLGLVWRDGFPTDDVLTHAIKELRRALGDDPRAPEIIETIPRVGYRLRASVRAVPNPEAHDVIAGTLTAANDAQDAASGESAESAAASSAALATAGGAAAVVGAGTRDPGATADAVGESVHRSTGATSPSAQATPPQIAVPAIAVAPRKPPRALWLAALSALILIALTSAFFLGRNDVAPVAANEAWTPPAAATRVPPVAITSDPGSEYFPALSPDGSSIAYVASAEGKIDAALMVKSRDPAALAVTLIPARSTVWMVRPTWSPDGARIAYAEVEGDDSCLLRVIPASGGTPQTVAPCEIGLIDSADWSPDGKTLYTSLSYTQQPGSRGVASIDIASGESTLLEYSPREPDDADVNPRVSPDGRWIAFRRGPNPYSDLWLVPIGGGDARPLAKFGANIRGFAWTPDSRAVIASSDHTGSQALYRVDIESGATVALGIEDAHFPSVARRAGFVTWHHEYELAQLAVFALRDGKLEGDGHLVAPASRADYIPVLSRSGRRLAFISERSGEPQVWVHDFETGQTSVLSAEDHSMPEMPQWAPDESAVLYISRGEAKSRLVHVDLATRRRSILTPDDERVRFGSFSSDGEWLLYSSDRSGSWQAWRMRNDGTGAERLTTTGGVDPRSWPGDDGIWYSKPLARGLFRYDPATREETRITNLVGYTTLGAYSVADGSLWLFRTAEDRREVRVLARPVAGGAEADDQAAVVTQLRYPGGTPWAFLTFDQARTRAVTNVVMRDGTDVFVTPLP